LVVTLFKEGKFDEALPLAKQALGITEKLFVEGDPQIDIALNNLGEVYFAKKDYASAKGVYQRLLASKEKKLGDDVTLSPILDRLAFLFYAERNFHNSEESYKRALFLREKNLGSSSAEVGLSLFNLAEFYRFHKNYKEAESRYEQALKIYGQHFGSDSPNFQEVRENYTCLLYENQKTDKIKELSKRKELYSAEHGLVEGDVLNGRALSLPKPFYPKEAGLQSLEGTIVIKVTIDEMGMVTDAKNMCQEIPYLTQASLQAARSARFSPTKLAGQPVKVTGVIVYNFIHQ